MSIMFKKEKCFSEDIFYQNRSGDNRTFYLSWHSNLKLVNVSYYNCIKQDDLLFAEDFNLQTAIKLRDFLNKILILMPKTKYAKSQTKRCKTRISEN